MKADKGEVVRKIRIARGQLDGILQMIEDDRYCIDISNQILATQAVLKKANQEILQAHIRNCVAEALGGNEAHPELEEVFTLLEKMTR